jgi:CofH subfamily radical SAM domain protein
MDAEVILKTALAGEEISSIEALILLRADDCFLPAIYHVADEINARRHRDVVSFVHARQINYSNVCRNACAFCSFFRRRGHPEAYTHTAEEVLEFLAATPDVTEVQIRGGLNPDLTLDYFCTLIREIKRAYPAMGVGGFSPAEVHFLSRRARLAPREVIARLKAAGLETMSGGGADILDDKMRKKFSTSKLKAHEWVDIVRAAHRAGIRTSASILFGHEEDEVHICEHLEVIRDLQRETGGFTEFVPIPFMPWDTELGRRTGRTNLVARDAIFRLLAVSRIYFHRTIPNLQGNWAYLGMEQALRALDVGVNDLGPTILDDDSIRNRASEDGPRVTPAEMVAAIRKAGKRPRMRDGCYNELALPRRLGAAAAR